MIGVALPWMVGPSCVHPQTHSPSSTCFSAWEAAQHSPHQWTPFACGFPGEFSQCRVPEGVWRAGAEWGWGSYFLGILHARLSLNSCSPEVTAPVRWPSRLIQVPVAPWPSSFQPRSSALSLVVPSLHSAHTLVDAPLLNAPRSTRIWMCHLFPAGTWLIWKVMGCVHVGLVAAP